MSKSNSVAGGSSATASFSETPGPVDSSQVGSWFEAMSKAWGEALDGQANKITTLSEAIGVNGQDSPSTIALLTAESLRMQFLSSNASTSTNSVGQALESLARK